MIRAGTLCEFLSEAIRLRNEEFEEQVMWELWLNRIHDKTYDEFRKSIKGESMQNAPTKEELQKIVNDSFTILSGFVPVDGVHADDGTISAAWNGSD